MKPKAKPFTERGRMPITVRRARVADLSQIIQLAQLRDGHKKKWSPSKRTGFTLQLRNILQKQENHRCWVALDDEHRVVGYAFASLTYSPIDDGMWMHVTELYVKPRFRSFGIGQRLMRTVKQSCTKAKVKGFWLVTHHNNVDALRFYRRHKMMTRTMKSCVWVG